MKICEDSICTGCAACAASCSLHAITMESDERGFLHPQIDVSKCVSCSKCKAVCPQNNKKISGNTGKIYAALARNDELRKRSSSGGIFFLLASWILRNGGVVFGAAYNEQMVVQHIAVFTEEELIKLQGSKYVQSQVRDTYWEAKSLLESGKSVLYTGTPCQIAGLRAYLNKDYDRLLTVDILCHGVPSPGVFRLYVENLQREYGKRVLDIQFRHKHLGWKNYITQVVFEDGSSENVLKDTYMCGFLKNVYLRESCYQCLYAKVERVGDITLGDFWGYQETAPEHIEDDNCGISLVMVNTDSGARALHRIKRQLALAPRELEEAKKGNPILTNSALKHERAHEFWHDYTSEMEWDDLCAKYFADVGEKQNILSMEDREYYAIPYNRRHARHLIHCWKVNLLKEMKGN